MSIDPVNLRSPYNLYDASPAAKQENSVTDTISPASDHLVSIPKQLPIETQNSLAAIHESIANVERALSAVPPDSNLLPEIELFRKLIDSFKSEIKLQEESGLITNQQINKQQEIQKILKKDLQSLSEQLDAASKKTNIAGWVATVLSSCVVALSIVQFAVIMIGTQGLGLPAAYATVQSGLALASGIATGTKVYFDVQKEKNEISLFGVQTQRIEYYRDLQLSIDRIKDTVDQISNYWSQLREIQKNRNEAAQISIR